MRGREALARNVARWTLAALMVFTGTVHLTRTSSFFGQLPPWTPARSVVIWISGVIEIALGLALALSPARWRATVGRALALLFVLVFPANVYQAVAGTDAFGLDSPASRWIRLLFQPVLILWALWASGAWPRRGSGSA
jgi:uncharacterized membrane protein